MKIYFLNVSSMFSRGKMLVVLEKISLIVPYIVYKTKLPLLN